MSIATESRHNADGCQLGVNSVVRSGAGGRSTSAFAPTADIRERKPTLPPSADFVEKVAICGAAHFSRKYEAGSNCRFV